MKKNIPLLISLILVFCLLVFQITITFITLESKTKGNVIAKENYSKLLFTNITMNNKTTSNISIDEKNNIIKINIENLNDFKEENYFTIDLVNIGNKKLQLTNYELRNINSFEADKVDINVSLKDNTQLDAKEKIRLKINIKYNGNSAVNNFYNVNIKFNTN
ncbi:MAG: hypothetical protein IJB83_02950 [Bacilli bacterium]|nr:hypothetical protein [Bacilli bacterium]